ncbi:MXAN_6640 family putative metalloprotease [Nocardioides sp. GCM10027113]|uniref:MXAN_6640 family putative metalloprotease n=1 Tax=unclassified Nocardioides TaxID=2615069 RepID=UPI003612F9E0
MRRSVVTAAVALALSVTSLPGATSASPTGGSTSDPADVPTAGTEPGLPALPPQAAGEALAEATAVLEGEPAPEGVSATLALRDLAVALPSLSPTEKEEARGLLARPTQGANDPEGFGYSVPSVKDCSRHLCIHWVESTADAPPGRAWVNRTMRVLKKVWKREVGELGYRRPLRDGDRGGNAKFDVYLKDVGSQGLYGYCAPEPNQGEWSSQGYCVLDDDFARQQFQAPPRQSLKVTAAHEFFHAIQFAYDYGEDRWLMEGTATWVEERVYDDIDDNRQYLPYGQVARPERPLDKFVSSGFGQYGNWAFFEYLTERFGPGIVREIWEGADGHWRNHSVKAVKRALPGKQRLTRVFRDYAAANTVPARTYPEGDAWPKPAYAAAHRLGADDRQTAGAVNVDHLAARHVVVRPRDDLQARSWFLEVAVDGPGARTAPGAVLVVHRRDGRVVTRPVPLDDAGDGSLTVRFGARTAKKATVTLANASTRYDCWEKTWRWACQGKPRDQRKAFDYRLRLVRR